MLKKLINLLMMTLISKTFSIQEIIKGNINYDDLGEIVLKERINYEQKKGSTLFRKVNATSH